MEAIEQTYWEDVPPFSMAASASRMRADGLSIVDCDLVPRMPRAGAPALLVMPRRR